MRTPLEACEKDEQLTKGDGSLLPNREMLKVYGCFFPNLMHVRFDLNLEIYFLTLFKKPFLKNIYFFKTKSKLAHMLLKKNLYIF